MFSMGVLSVRNRVYSQIVAAMCALLTLGLAHAVYGFERARTRRPAADPQRVELWAAYRRVAGKSLSGAPWRVQRRIRQHIRRMSLLLRNANSEACPTFDQQGPHLSAFAGHESLELRPEGNGWLLRREDRSARPHTVVETVLAPEVPRRNTRGQHWRATQQTTTIEIVASELWGESNREQRRVATSSWWINERREGTPRPTVSHIRGRLAHLAAAIRASGAEPSAEEVAVTAIAPFLNGQARNVTQLEEVHFNDSPMAGGVVIRVHQREGAGHAIVVLHNGGPPGAAVRFGLPLTAMVETANGHGVAQGSYGLPERRVAVLLEQLP